jgi:hypothetical protein
MTILVGQQVFFHPLKGVIHHSLPHGKVLAATVASVLPDGRLNLSVLDINGESHGMTEVPVLKAGDTAPDRGYYVTETAEEPSTKPVPVVHAPAPLVPAPVLIPTPKSAEDLPLSAAAEPAKA